MHFCWENRLILFFDEQFGSVYQNLKVYITFDSAIPFWGISYNYTHPCAWRSMCKVIGALFKRAKDW